MYYEEKWIDGKLMHRSSPDGKWKESTKEYPKKDWGMISFLENY